MSRNCFFRIFSISVFAIALITGCDNEMTPDVAYTEYIEAYTGGIVSGNSDVVIKFTSPVTGLSGTDEEISRKTAELFKFSPKIEGSANWVSSDQVVFTPELGGLKAGKEYKCSFSLGEIVDVSKGHEKFKFKFYVADKEAKIETGNIVIKANDRQNASVSGVLRLSEALATDEPESLLKFKYDGGGELSAKMGDNDNEVEFTISGLARPSSGVDKELKINFVPGATGFAPCEQETIMIPACGAFKAIDAVLNTERFMDIVFSDPLDPSQNLNGLVAVSDRYSENAVDVSDMRIIDNVLRIYDNNDRDVTSVHILPGVSSLDGERLEDGWTKSIDIPTPLPSVWFPFDGNILPDSGSLIFPFCAVNLNAVDVSVIKIFTNNVLTFLQENDLDGSYNLRRAGRLIYRNTLRLDAEGIDTGTPHQYNVDLSGLFKNDPNAIYRVKLSFKKEYYTGGDNAGGGLVRTDVNQLTDEDEMIWDEPSAYYYDNSYDWSEYRWADRNNPDTPSYYMDYDYPSRNLMASDLAVIAKYSGASDGKSMILWTAASNVLSAEPVSGAEINVYNYQLQPIGNGKSSATGLAEIKCSGRPFAVKVTKGESTTYLKVTDGSEKSLSRFDIGGEILHKGLKGFVYGDRGVWRPGDTLHLTLVVHGNLPDSHPAVMTVYSPEGQFFMKRVVTGANGFYGFDIATLPDSPTGTWHSYFTIGGATFHKSLPIEAIKPNRLKINVDIGGDMLCACEKTRVVVASNWLTGPAASGLQTKVEMTLRRRVTSFKGFEEYSFSDLASEFGKFETELMSAKLDVDGNASASVTMPKVEQAPGLLAADIVCSVMEDGGDQSSTFISKTFSPYNAYVGIRLPDRQGGYVETGTEHKIPVAVVNAKGARVSGHRIEYRIFKLKWSWWWESRKEPLDSYVNGSGATAVDSGVMTSDDRDLMIPFLVEDKDWGRYLIYVRDLDSGHCSGGIVYADWPAYRGRADKKDPDAPAMLSFSLDKKSYRAGETATVFIPAAENGRALVSLENGSEVIKSEWVKTEADSDKPWKFKVVDDMAPNFYVHITLVQPYGNIANDLPVRMYGVVPVEVENPDSHLDPVILMPDKLHPEEEFSITVKESKGKPMTYTLAIVDEGLLDLTAFRTPDPWNAMYRREALGVRTWDMYDDVFQSGGGAMRAMFSIGGDEGIIRGAHKENRFNPVVKFIGPVTMKSGSRTHKIKLPMYVGSVRVMLVAGNGTAYGNAEKTVPVTSPVMIVSTLPRVAGCGEKITLPVNVFVMEDSIANVNVSVKCEGSLAVAGNASRTVAFSGKGDNMLRFTLNAGAESGNAKVMVTAEGGGHKMTEIINMEVRNTSPHIVSTSSCLLAANENRIFRFDPFKETDEDKAWVEANSYPAMDWNALFNYMKVYPHSCSEQLCARGLSLIYAMSDLSLANADKARSILPEILNALYGRQRPDGGISYWQSDSHSDEWVSSMALEFLTLARAEGYGASSDVINSLVKFQKRCVQNFKTSKSYDDLVQVYRLYTLALAGSPDEASMNRLKMSGKLSWQGSMMLASVYSICGKKSVGEEILKNLASDPKEWIANEYTYGTPLRDKAIALEALVRSDNISGAISYATDVKGTDGVWSMSTQESAFVAKAYKELSKKVAKGQVSVEVSNSMLSDSRDKKVIYNVNPTSGETAVKNTSTGPVYVKFTSVSQAPANAPVDARSDGIKLNVKYIDANGNSISPASLRQGTEFRAVISVANANPVSDYAHVALTQIIPSGWEIVNERLNRSDSAPEETYDRLDIRDDRNMFYFSLPRNTYKKFTVRLRAAYEGEYILPSISCEDMYDASVFACTASGRCSVTR